MAGVRAQQKEKTRRALIHAALNQLCPESSFSSLSLREVAREAGIAPTSFYRHFQNMDELGLTLVDEGGLALRQLLRQSRQRIADGGSIIEISVHTFMDYVTNNKNIFRLMLQEQAGTTKEFRLAIAREIDHFKKELTDYLRTERQTEDKLARIQSDAIVRVVFSAGADILDMNAQERAQLTEQTIQQVRMIARGAANLQETSATNP
ncbi:MULTISPECIES: HTH-type transcriptional repressor FabR [Gammaproteobacteria]|uniref:HTH-type transcriptional repressor FabR n=1 Tax=Gammaproteobacteria TaxID=1236 RepID=UPI000DCFCF63|nr:MULTISPECIES: HTH-type transcriptional repressor FabR [Gammaproteobacteria]RTE86457.1 HTH-type transcriptional repressor FabR [Aliidiomarina sp. B3213]TCZ90988.1 HTH-type transcriptional repressor FabR [Lysobacter sp. N42]